MTPHTCPVCEGHGRRPDKPKKDCRACDGSCIVWEPGSTTFIDVRPRYPYAWWGVLPPYGPYWYGNGYTVPCTLTTDSLSATTIIDASDYTTGFTTGDLTSTYTISGGSMNTTDWHVT